MAGTYALSLLVAAQCVPPPEPEPTPSPAPSVEPPNDGTPCGWTCAAFRRLGCEEGEPTPAGDECEDWCQNGREHGYELARDRECAAGTRTCDEVRDCPGL